MNKFGSKFEFVKLIGVIVLLFIIVLFLIVEGFDFVGFLIVILLYFITVSFELYYSYCGLMLKNDRLIVFNIFNEKRFSILFTEIVKVDLVVVFRNSGIEIVTKDYNTRRFSLKGYSIDDLKNWTNKFQELEIDAEFTDKR